MFKPRGILEKPRAVRDPYPSKTYLPENQPQTKLRKPKYRANPMNAVESEDCRSSVD
jgi:hypothetical protein